MWCPQTLHGASQIPGARQVLSTPTSLPTTFLAAWWCLSGQISLKMQIMTPAPLTSCAFFVYVRENDNYYEKK